MNKVVELINRRRRQILVHSCIYYRFNDNLIDDFTYDIWAKELVQLQEDYPNESKEAALSEEFKDFTGTCFSGYNLPISRPNVESKAKQLLEYNKNKLTF